MNRITQKLSALLILITFLTPMEGCSSSPVLDQTPIPSDIPSPVDTPVSIPSPTLTSIPPTPSENKLDVVIEVVNSSGDPIDRAAVRVFNPNSQEGQAGWTDEKGSILFGDIAGFPLSISVQALGYLSQKQIFETLPETPSIRVMLDPDPQSDKTCAPEDVYATARYMKMDLYNSIDYQPDIIVFGSSRAYTFSPQYIEQLTDRRVFNMAINFGSILDIYYYARYIFARQADHPPQLLLVEAQINTINQSSLEGVTPIELWSLLPDENIFQPEIDLCDHIFDQKLNQKYLDNASNTGSLLWVFQPDGMALHRPINYKQYQTAVQRQIPSLQERALCESLSPIGLEYVQKLIDLAGQYNTAVIFFRPPFQGDLYHLIHEDARYKGCSDLLNNFMQGLIEQNKNAFFRDFSDYEPIISMDFYGFYDGQHFTPEASNQIIDLLLPDIQSTLE